jgi:hypothetical protein
LESARFDYSLGECSIEETGEGYLKLRGVIAKPGVYPYFENGKIIMELVPPEELFSVETIKSAEGVPLTDDHPTENGLPIMLTSGDAPVHTRGAVFSPAIEDGKLAAKMTIWDANCISACVSGEKRQLSIGRTTFVEEAPGEWQGQPYDRVQRRIRINHVAIVDKGRQGPEVKFLIDRGESMLTYRTDAGKDATIAPEVMDDIQARNQKIKDLEAKARTDAAELEALQSRLAAVNPAAPDPKGEAEKQKLLAQIEALTQSVSAFETKYAALEQAVPQMVEDMANEKMQLNDAVKAVAPEVKTDGLSPREMRLAVIAKSLPYDASVKIDSLPDEVVKARFDAAMDMARIQANLQRGPAGAQRIDRDEVARKRDALANLHTFDFRKEAK